MKQTPPKPKHSDTHIHKRYNPKEYDGSNDVFDEREGPA